MTTAPPPVDAGRHDHGRRPLGRVSIDRRGELLDSRPDIGDHRADELPARSLGPVAGRDGFPHASNGQLAQPSDALKKAHGDSSSVVPDVASSGDVATVELSANAARTMASPRRVAGTRSPENVARSRARAAAIRELAAAGDLERDWLAVAADIETAADQAEAATA